jgi:DNA polymerase-3 subunit alpha
MDHGNRHRAAHPRGPHAAGQGPELPLLATNDLHYVDPQDDKAQDALLCVQSGNTLLDPGRFKFEGTGYYLKSPAEMRHLFRELPGGLRQHPAHRRAVRGVLHRAGGALHAALPLPRGRGRADLVRQGGQAGLRRRFPEGVPEYAASPGHFEADVIVSKGYAGYFLVVADFINWAKDHGIRSDRAVDRVPGSMCAYAMGITDLDPIPHGLIFERFLNPERMSMPDFDVDFDERRRGEVIQYVTGSTAPSGSRRSSPTARSRPSRRSRTPRGSWVTPSRWGRSSPRRCRP